MVRRLVELWAPRARASGVARARSLRLRQFGLAVTGPSEPVGVVPEVFRNQRLAGPLAQSVSATPEISENSRPLRLTSKMR